MKVFVYSKKTSNNIAVVNNVIRTEVYDGTILFVTESDERITFDTKTVKTTTYQN